MSTKLKITTGFLIAAALILSLAAAPAQAQKAGKPLAIESVLVRDMTLRDFAELMTRGCAAEWKVLVSEKAGEKRISFYLSGTGVEETIRTVCATCGLWHRRSPHSDIVQIVTMEEYKQGLDLYADEVVEVVPVLYPAPEDIGDALARLFKDRVVWDPPPRNIADDMPRIERALDRMDTIADRATLVNKENSNTTTGSTRDRYNSSSNRGRYGHSSSDRGRYDERSGGAMGQASEKQTLQEVIDQQRREMEVQKASRGGPDDLGGKDGRPGLVYLSASPSANALVLRSSDAASVETIKNVIQQLDKPKAQVLLEVKVFDISLSDEVARGVDWLFKSGSFSGGQATGITTPPGNTISAPNPATLVPLGAGLDPRAAVFAYVSDQIRARIQLLQDENRIRSLATPSLLVADNEASRIFIGSEVTVLEKVQQEQSFVGELTPTPVTTYDVTAPRKRIGTTLLITPKIHADRTVTIRLLQEETQLGQERVVRYGQTDADQFTSQDVEERSVTTTVLAKDGGDVVIGGLIRKRKESQEIGVPWLMRIPLVGNIFKRKIRLESRSELLVLIRPHVLLAPGEGETASRDFSRRASRYEKELKNDKSVLRDHDGRMKAKEGKNHEP